MSRPISRKYWKIVTDPPELVRVARERTKFMLPNFHMISFNLNSLVASAYLQGAHDAAQVAIERGYVPPGCRQELFDAGDGI